MVKKLVAFAMATVMLFSSSVGATELGSSKRFNDAISTTKEKQWDGEVVESRPLVILMNFTDYKYTELEDREDWTINLRPGEDFTPELYEEIFFNDETYTAADGNEYVSVRKYLELESGGSYDFDGEVHGWYEAENGYKFYGQNTDIWGMDQHNAALLVREAIEAAAMDQNVDLSKFDVMDKNDHDGDGNYFEPDGIIDSVVVLHPGKGESWDNSLGEDAIWPFKHSFTKFFDFEPYEFVDKDGKSWAMDDFAVFEQDLPVDLFIHEFGHIMGLPDLYSTTGGEPPVENWSNMGGSYLGEIRGSMPNSYGAFPRKLMQDRFESEGVETNWQNSKTIKIEEITEEGLDVILDQSTIRGENYDTIKIELPERAYEIAKPTQGKYCYYSGKGDYLKNSMSTTVDLSIVEEAKLQFKTWYDIDPGFDFASVQVREVGSENWIAVEGNLTTEEVDQYVIDNETEEEIRANRNPGHGITKDSAGEWVDANFDLSEFAGKNVELRINFWTDSNTPEQGIYMDEIKITSGDNVLLEDNAEGEEKFVLDGFEKSTGEEFSNHYYLLEWRNGNNGLSDQGLTQGYRGINYDPGLVVWYINERWVDTFGRPDQNTTARPGEAYASIVDADQEVIFYSYDSGESGADYADYQMHDAAFSLQNHEQYFYRSDEGKWLSVDTNGNMNPVFDDSRDYSNKGYEKLGVNLPEYGLNVFVVDESSDRSTARIHIAKASDDNLKEQILKEEYIENIEVRDGKLHVTANDVVEKMQVAYQFEGTEKIDVIDMDKNGENFVGELNLVDHEEAGKYSIAFIQIMDSEGNAKGIYNSNTNKGFGVDLSKGDFEAEANKSEEDVASMVEFNTTRVERVDNKYLIKLDGVNNSTRGLELNVFVEKKLEDGRTSVEVENFNLEALGTINEVIEVEREDNVVSVRVYIIDENANIIEIHR